jgi:hypothetical protein
MALERVEGEAAAAEAARPERPIQAAGDALATRAGLSVEDHVAALGRLSTDAARRRLMRQVGRAYGNRYAARVLARRETAEGLTKIAASVKAAAAIGRSLRAQRLAWGLVEAYCPEKGFGLSGSRYDAGQKAFALDGTILVVGDDVVDRVAGGAADTVGRELTQLLTGLPDPFATITAGVGIKSAPSHLSLPLVADVGLQKAWEKSLPGDKSQEQGGVLVSGTSGYEFRAGAAGTSGTFPFNRQDVKKGETLVSVAHTHPYSAKEGGHTDVSFSGQDLALFATQKERMSIVRSGDHDFLAARSVDFDIRLLLSDSSKLFAAIKKHWNDVFTAASGSLPDRARAATKSTCLKFDLLYYEGSKGTLAQPQDMIDARNKP